jgi:hypothetical protein
MGIPMSPHPAFADRRIPPRVTLGSFQLDALGPGDLDADFAAVTETAQRLHGLFGDDWPRGLTREADAIDLAWHAKEFELHRSFAWVVRGGPAAPGDARYLGCAYVFPDWSAQGPLDAYYWLRAGAEAFAPELADRFRAWLAAPPWPDLAITLTGRPAAA